MLVTTKKCWLPGFSPFPTMFTSLSEVNTIILLTFNLPLANAFCLDQSNFLYFGKGYSIVARNIITTVKPCYFESRSYENPGFFELYPKSRQKLNFIAPKIVRYFESRKSENSNTRVSPEHQITSLT